MFRFPPVISRPPAAFFRPVNGRCRGAACAGFKRGLSSQAQQQAKQELHGDAEITYPVWLHSDNARMHFALRLIRDIAAPGTHKDVGTLFTRRELLEIFKKAELDSRKEYLEKHVRYLQKFVSEAYLERKRVKDLQVDEPALHRLLGEELTVLDKELARGELDGEKFPAEAGAVASTTPRVDRRSLPFMKKRARNLRVIRGDAIAASGHVNGNAEKRKEILEFCRGRIHAALRDYDDSKFAGVVRQGVGRNARGDQSTEAEQAAGEAGAGREDAETDAPSEGAVVETTATTAAAEAGSISIGGEEQEDSRSPRPSVQQQFSTDSDEGTTASNGSKHQIGSSSSSTPLRSVEADIFEPAPGANSSPPKKIRGSASSPTATTADEKAIIECVQAELRAQGFGNLESHEWLRTIWPLARLREILAAEALVSSAGSENRRDDEKMRAVVKAEVSDRRDKVEFLCEKKRLRELLRAEIAARGGLAGRRESAEREQLRVRINQTLMEVMQEQRCVEGSETSADGENQYKEHLRKHEYGKVRDILYARFLKVEDQWRKRIALTEVRNLVQSCIGERYGLELEAYQLAALFNHATQQEMLLNATMKLAEGGATAPGKARTLRLLLKGEIAERMRLSEDKLVRLTRKRVRELLREEAENTGHRYFARDWGDEAVDPLLSVLAERAARTGKYDEAAVRRVLRAEVLAESGSAARNGERMAGSRGEFPYGANKVNRSENGTADEGGSRKTKGSGSAHASVSQEADAEFLDRIRRKLRSAAGGHHGAVKDTNSGA